MRGVIPVENQVSDALIHASVGCNRGRLHIESMEHPLLRHLLNQQLIEGHPCGGIDTDPLTCQCRVNNRNVPGLYNIGPLSKGSLFSTNSIWFNARCTESWAKKWAVEFCENVVKETL